MTELRIQTIDPQDADAVARWTETLRSAYSEGREAVWWTTPEAAAESLRGAGPDHVHHGLIASRGTEIVGAAEVDAPDGEPASIEIGVPKEHRRQGIGTALARRIRALLTDHEPRTVSTELHAEDGLAAARRWGIEVGNVEHRLLLDLPVTAATLDALHRERPGVSTRSWVGACPEDLVDDWARLTQQMEEDVPLGTLTRVVSPTDRDRIRRTEDRLDREGYDLVRTLARLDGRSVGYTSMLVARDAPEIVVQDDTLVDRDHRGHGLGRALKVANLRRLMDTPHARTARWVQTWTATSNAPMLALNAAIGFRVADTLHEGEGPLEGLPDPGTEHR